MLAGGQPGEVPMTDYPRFEHVRGEPDVAHEAYNGGVVVSFAFRLVDRWMGLSRRRSAGEMVPGSARGGIEVHERAPLPVRAKFLPGSADSMAPVQMLHREVPEEVYSREFLLGSARTMKTQRALLAAVVAVLVVLVVQGWSLLERPGSRTASNPAPDSVSVQQADRAMAQFLP
jgi:hypothetical protein